MNVAQAYRQTQVGTVGQGEIVVMLYDGALRFLAQAREKMEVKDFAGKGILISKAISIIHELDSCLNMEAGGEVSRNLHQLYFICTTRLLQVNLKLDFALLDNVVETLTGLRSAFAQILGNAEAQAVAAQIGARTAAQNANHDKPRPLSNPAVGNTVGLTAGLSGLDGMRVEIKSPTQNPYSAAGAATAAKGRAAYGSETSQIGAGQNSVGADSPQGSQGSQGSQSSPAASPGSQVDDVVKGGFVGKKVAMYGKMLQNQP